jgi:DNA repair photolyase
MARASEGTRRRLRWEAVDGDESAPRLFGGGPERVTHPEFRDLEFIHVAAKSIINEVPAAARLPFRHTINVYRGCSHACVYCLSGDTPILMANGRTKPLDHVSPGDRIYGTERRGSYRRYVVTEVLDRWATVKPAFSVVLADGTRLIASSDHRFLTDRGWKHVTGVEQGADRRPHLTMNDSLMGTGHFPAPPKVTTEYREGYLCGLIRGDGHIGTYSYERKGRVKDTHHRFRLALTDNEALTRARNYLAHFGVQTRTFDFQRGSGARRPLGAIRNSSRLGVAAIEGLIAWSDGSEPDWDKGFLAGIFDAEGSCASGILRIANTDAVILDRITSALERFGFHSVLEPVRPNGCRTVRLTGGLRERLRFFHLVDPAITRKRNIEGTALKSDADLRITGIERLGIDMPMYDITTGTGDFIANGVVSHNCFARPTHEYLDLNAGRDFERVIVVKVNAPELLRRELHPGRWAGEHIAMGTNTDPYQRCEGRYRLTRRVLETLTEFPNPFSILTKSALVLRDLDVLQDANERTDITVSFSIGTLDTDVWRATEPGTPHPRKRVEAIAALREIGIRSGVLIAPVIPGVSDRREQLDEVVRACIDAGATSISPILLHLRPGVKEQFLPWVERERPDLLPTYERLYPRSYAPRAERNRLAQTVRELVAEHGGPRPQASHRTRRPPAERDERASHVNGETAGEQLNLDL